MTVQVVARIPADVAARVDELVRTGEFASRSDAVRVALDALIEERRRAAVGQAIVEGYRRIPQAAGEAGWSDPASAAMIAEEPW